MKLTTSFLITLVLLAVACKNELETDKPTERITRIETGLKPALMIDGREYGGWTIEERMQHYNVPGVSISFFENDKIVWTKTYGFIDKEESRPIDTDTRFQAASISKPVAASGMMTLVENGELDLDKDVNTYLTDYQIADWNPGAAEEEIQPEKVTLRRLVTHTAGLTVHGFRGYASDEPVPTTLQVLQGSEPANSDAIVTDTLPGSLWRYSGGGYTVMQYIVEQKFNSSFHEFMRETVLDPVQMSRSTYQQPLPEENTENTAVGYRPDGSPVKGQWHTYPEQAAAGLWTTPSDLARWAMAIQRAYNGSTSEFITPATAKQILTKHLGDWGLGPGLGGTGDSLVFRHGGANEGYRCNLIAFATGNRQGAVIMTNGDLGGPLMTEVMNAIDAEYGWNIFKPRVKQVIEMSTDELKAYVGVFIGGPGIEVVTYVEDGELKGKVGDNSFFLYPEKMDQFFDSQDAQTIIFNRDKTDSVIGFEVEGMTFERKAE